jgi:hypothetical protein
LLDDGGAGDHAGLNFLRLGRAGRQTGKGYKGRQGHRAGEWGHVFPFEDGALVKECRPWFYFNESGGFWCTVLAK